MPGEVRGQREERGVRAQTGGAFKEVALARHALPTHHEIRAGGLRGEQAQDGERVGGNDRARVFPGMTGPIGP